MASNDCLPYEKNLLTYLGAVVDAAPSVVAAEVVVEDSVVTEVAVVAAEPVVADVEVESLVSSLLQAAKATAIANTKKSFFMFSVLDFV